MSSPQDTSTRKLAAIMFTDIKAFSWKMATNEIAAMQILKTHDSMMKESIEQYGGRVIKSIGDSFMVDFPSAVNGVSCALALQRRFWDFNQGKENFDKIEVRMGLHLGDVIDVGNDMYGDGVNIASRVEAITEPNRICITQDIYSQVKKKMHELKVFAIGPMKFKNIDEPVEVYEILMTDIPELSAPSQTAKQAPSRKVAEKTVEREAKEAKSVEARKQKLQEEIDEKIKVHYKKAEIFFQKGMLDEAEAELAEIEKLSAGGQPEKSANKEEDEKQKIIQAHYKKAEESFHKGQLDDAEKAIQEIYRLVPMHYGAQMIMAQIEEERFRLAEERRRKIESERRAMQEKTEKLETLKAKIQKHIEREEFAEGLQAVEEMLGVDEGNSEAEQLLQRIDELQNEKAERERAAADEAERILQATLEKRAEQAKSLEPKVEEVVVEKSSFNKKLVMQIVGGIAALAILYFVGSFIKKTFFPNTASIAVVMMNNAQGGARGSIGKALATQLAEDFARLEHVSVVSASSALASHKSSAKDAIASELGAQQLLLISTEYDSADVALKAELFDVEKKSLWAETLTANNLLESPDVRKQLVTTVLEQLGVDAEVAEFRSPTRSEKAYRNYLMGLALVGQRTALSLRQAIDTLSAATQLDNSFTLAYALRAQAFVELFVLGGESNNDLLGNAQRDLQSAGKSDNALADQTRGTVLRYRQQFVDAKQAIEKSLSLLPQNAACYRELAMLALSNGTYVEGAEHATKALALDPKNPESHVTAGIVAQMKQEHEAALKYYDDAIKAGANDSLISVRYKLSAWASLQMRKEAEDFCKDLQQKFPQDYRTNYWAGRALQQRGQVDEAKRYLDQAFAIAEKAREANKNDAVLKGFLAVIKARLGRLEEAKRDMELAVQLHGSNPVLLYRRAHVYAIEGEKGQSQVFRALKEAVNAEFNVKEILSAEFIVLQKQPEFASAIVRTSTAQ